MDNDYNQFKSQEVEQADLNVSNCMRHGIPDRRSSTGKRPCPNVEFSSQKRMGAVLNDNTHEEDQTDAVS